MPPLAPLRRTAAKRTLRSQWQRLRREDGSMSMMGIYVFLGMATVSAFAIDFSFLMAARSQLQVSADAAAHAALYTRDADSASEAATAALDIGKTDLPDGTYGGVISVHDVTFGRWDYDTHLFTADPNSRSAVQVEVGRETARDNAVASMMFKMVGKEDWDLRATSVFTTFRPSCFREGFVAEDTVDIQSNNGFYNGFCIHSNTNVSLNSNNYFQSGTIVSMPDLTTLDLPRSGFTTNEGLEAALREGYYRLRILAQMEDIITGLRFSDPDYLPADMLLGSAVVLRDVRLKAEDFTPNRVHSLTCNGGRQAQFENDTELSDVVLVTNCPVKFGQGTVLENVIIATTSTSARSLNAPSTLTLGRNDACLPGGGTQLLTMGGVSFASDLHMYGSQIIAQGSIDFAANASGIMGAAMVAGGQIDGTSNMEMGFCGDGMEGNFEAEYFRLAH